MNEPPQPKALKVLSGALLFYSLGSLDISRFNLAFCRLGYPVPGCFLLSIVSFLSSGIFTLHSHSGVANRVQSLPLSSVRSITHVTESIGVIFHVAAEDPEFYSSSTRPSRLAFF